MWGLGSGALRFGLGLRVWRLNVCEDPLHQENLVDLIPVNLLILTVDADHYRIEIHGHYVPVQAGAITQIDNIIRKARESDLDTAVRKIVGSDIDGSGGGSVPILDQFKVVIADREIERRRRDALLFPVNFHGGAGGYGDY